MKITNPLQIIKYCLVKAKNFFVGAASGTTEGHVVTFGADGKTIKDSGHTIATSVPANAKFTDTTYTVATTSKDGLLSKTDKSKLDGIATNAQVNTIEAVKVNGTALDITSKSVNIDLSSYATTSSLEDYAKKADISTVFKYKGTVANYSELPSNAETGDVYNITAADTANNIKAGDNVAWSGTAWDNLSGIMEFEEISEADIDAVFAEVFA
ncbi:MAG: hypothetical protein IJZ64_04905 [Ruminococcus sp.]|nr:hypothetical protein [Ruminococcus sp.]